MSPKFKRRRFLFIALASMSLIVFCCFACWWSFIAPETITPTAPVPERAILLRHSRSAAVQAFWNTDWYLVEAPSYEVVMFYKKVATGCHQNEDAAGDIPSVPNFVGLCYGSAWPFGGYVVKIGKENSSEDSRTLIVVRIRWASDYNP